MRRRGSLLQGEGQTHPLLAPEISTVVAVAMFASVVSRGGRWAGGVDFNDEWDIATLRL